MPREIAVDWSSIVDLSAKEKGAAQSLAAP
jgi:hypothetical protein